MFIVTLMVTNIHALRGPNYVTNGTKTSVTTHRLAPQVPVAYSKISAYTAGTDSDERSCAR